MDGGLLIKRLAKVKKRKQRIGGNDFVEARKIIGTGQQVRRFKIMH